ncbi:putative integral membrane protein Tmp21-I [Danaus plexippus plexippus]|uniref:Integral membrane protein Tmp21-I n=1 Tax=Danaus plexippus plexippus TaxID=278856 RepID=A0A212F3C7_DANPL|nr:putative integral membrane protein Tmp21-I [Danaus plexippus plexippus]
MFLSKLLFLLGLQSPSYIERVYKVCFSNEFSTFSHKLVYMELNVGPEEPLPGIGDHATVMTQLETSAEEIHSALNKIIDHQTHHRLREAQGRKRAEDLNERVNYWSMGETLAIVCVAFAQIMILKNFFSDRPTQYTKIRAKTPLTKAHGYAMSGLCSASPDIVTNRRLADRADQITAIADKM